MGSPGAVGTDGGVALLNPATPPAPAANATITATPASAILALG